MKLALVINGGAPHATYTVIARALLAQARADGVDAAVIRAGEPGAPFLSAAEGERCYRLRAGPGPWRYATAALDFWRALSRERPDLVHIHGIGRDFWGALPVLWLKRLPMVLTLHGGDPLGMRGARGLVARRLLARAAIVTSVSRRFLKDLETLRGLSPRLRHVPNGADPPVREAPPSAVPDGCLLFVGGVHLGKGLDLLLFALHDLALRGLRPSLAVCGEDLSGGRMADLARRLGLAERVRFLGPVPHASLLGLLPRARAYVSPSRQENQSIALLEAMAAGLPVVAADVGGTPELVQDGANGLLFKAGDAAALSACLERLEDADLRRRLGEAAARTAARYSWRSAWLGYRAAYAEALGRPARADLLSSPLAAR